MIFSKPCQYAILAMTYLAERDDGRLVAIREIGRRTDVPAPILAKIIGKLSRHGLVSSRRGPKGGVRLGRAPAEVTVRDIVEAIDGAPDTGRCVLGFAECGNGNPCPVHRSWRHARDEIDRTLHGQTLASLTRNRARKAKSQKKERSHRS